MKIINIQNPDFVVSADAKGIINIESGDVALSLQEFVYFDEKGRLVKEIGGAIFEYNNETKKFDKSLQ